MSTELTHVQTAVAEFDKVAAGIAALQKQYAGIVYEVTTSKGMEAAKEARAAVREPRYEVERVRKDAKAPILALGKEIDERAKKITSELLAIEGPIDEQIKNEEARKEREKQAKIDAEIKRVAAIDARIETIRNWPAQYTGKPSALVEQQVRVANEYTIDAFFEEKAEQAQAVLDTSRVALAGILSERKAHEAEQARIVTERAELEALRKQQAERDRLERERIAEEEKAAKALRDAEAARQAEELRKLREEHERIQRESEAKLAAERKAQREEAERIEAAQAVEAKRLAAERAEFDRQQREAREAKEREDKIKAEQARIASIQRPGDDEIVAVLATHYQVPTKKVIEWLASYDQQAAA